MSGLRPLVYFFAFIPTKILWLTPQSLSITEWGQCCWIFVIKPPYTFILLNLFRHLKS